MYAVPIVVLLMEEILHHLRFIVYPSIYRVLHIPNSPDFFRRQHDVRVLLLASDSVSLICWSRKDPWKRAKSPVDSKFRCNTCYLVYLSLNPECRVVEHLLPKKSEDFPCFISNTCMSAFLTEAIFRLRDSPHKPTSLKV